MVEPLASSLGRRGFLTGIGTIICAPAIVRASSLMPVKVWRDSNVLTEDSLRRIIYEVFANRDRPQFIDLTSNNPLLLHLNALQRPLKQGVLLS